MKRKSILLTLVLALVLSTLPLSGSFASDAVTTIHVGIGSSPVPFCYLDENNELTGYEYDILAEIDNRLPQYEFVYETADTTNLFIGLDTNTYDLIAHHLGWNTDREAKYLFSKLGNWNNGVGYVIIALPGRTDLNTEDDLVGKSVEVGTSFNGAQQMEEYNRNHDADHQINIVYNNGGNEQFCADILNGVVDATITDGWMFDQWKQSFGAGLEAYGNDNIFGENKQGQPSGRFIYNYGNEAFRDEIDTVIQELIDDGTMSALSLKYFGVDHAKAE